MGYPVDLQYTYLVEPFGTTRGRAFPHSGDDFARKKVAGKPVQEQPDILAAFSGTVVAAGWHAQAGNRTVIRYWFGRWGVYAHQAKLLVSKGQNVTEGKKIGLLGGTGKVTGPHLHYSQYTSEARALSGVVQYWQGVKWASVDAWAAASGLVRPIYKTTDKGDAPATGTPIEEDDMYSDTDRARDELTNKGVVQVANNVASARVQLDRIEATLNRIETIAAQNKWALTDGTAGLRRMVADVRSGLSTVPGAGLMAKVELADGELGRIADAVADEQAGRLAGKP